MNNQNLKYVLRRISKNKLIFLIFIGLVVGLTASIIVYSKVSYELSFDKYHTLTDNIYRICRINANYLDGESEYRAGTYFPLPELAEKKIPEINTAVKLFYKNRGEFQVTSKDGQDNKIEIDYGVVFTESSFFDVFDFGEGNKNWIKKQNDAVLSTPFSAVLTQKTARKFFGDKNPIGRPLTFEGEKYYVKGVINDLPQNTDFPFEVFLSISTYFDKLNPGIESSWGALDNSFHCYVVLNENKNLDYIEDKLIELYNTHSGHSDVGQQLFELQPLSKVHKESKYGNYNNRTISAGLLSAIGLFGFFIFLVACFNYSNFFCAETSKAEKQIAIKRIIGGNTFSIVYQFFLESFVVVLSALIFSLPITTIILNKFYYFIDIPKGYFPEVNFTFLFFMSMILFLGSVLPVLMSTFNLKAKSLSTTIKKNSAGNTSTNIIFRKSSVVFQFIVAQAMIIVTLIIIKQIYFINNKELGYKSGNVIVAKLPENAINKLKLLKNELELLSNVQNCCFSSVSPAESRNWNGVEISVYDNKNKIDTETKIVDDSYFDIYSFDFIAGGKLLPNDTLNTIVVNREFVEVSGFINVDDALGAAVNGLNHKPVYIKGVVENFHSGSLHDQIRPCVFHNMHNWYNIINIELATIKGEDLNSSEALLDNVNIIAKKWGELFPDKGFDYNFLDERIANYYHAEYKALKIFSLLASLCILICLMGILSLSISMNEVRINEIGVRKVNGAKIGEIITLLNSDFVKWVIIALIIASPIVYYTMNLWLKNFAYKTDISWWLFAITGISVLIFTLTTVSWQSWRAARKNPVEALRYE